MILEFMRSLGVWNWFIAGVVLLALEIFAPGNIFVWFGVAAIVTGAVAYFAADLGWQIELIIFVVLAVVLALAGRRLFARASDPGEQPLLNDRAQRIVGSVYVLGAPIIDGKGRIRIDDTQWRVTGPDVPSGTRVRVISADGPVLSVVRAD
jgi:membrane protein implicated in regulation of membrane protease activity